MGIDAQLLLKIKSPVTPELLRKWSLDAMEAVGRKHFNFYNEKPPFALCENGVYWQDGPDIHAAEGETLIEISLSSRYYGIGYERGDILGICAIAEWCDLNIPNCEVWYGGDSSGVEAELFDEALRKKLKAHLYGPHGRDYYNYPGSQEPPKPPVDCKLCIDDLRIRRYGWGGDYAAWICGACGKKFSTEDSGATWKIDLK